MYKKVIKDNKSKNEINVSFYINDSQLQRITKLADKQDIYIKDIYEIAVNLFCDNIEEMIKNGKI